MNIWPMRLPRPSDTGCSCALCTRLPIYLVLRPYRLGEFEEGPAEPLPPQFSWLHVTAGIQP